MGSKQISSNCLHESLENATEIEANNVAKPLNEDYNVIFCLLNLIIGPPTEGILLSFNFMFRLAPCSEMELIHFPIQSCYFLSLKSHK